MPAAPDAAAILGDALLCLGLGLLLAALRDILGLVLGNGRIMCAVWDALALAAAAVLLCGFAAGRSVIGVARWYMAAAMAAGAFGWYAGISEILHAVLSAAVDFCLKPLLLLRQYLIFPLKKRFFEKILQIKQKRGREKSKKAKKQLQKQQKVLYN